MSKDIAANLESGLKDSNHCDFANLKNDAQLLDLDQYPLLDLQKGIELIGSEEVLLEILLMLSQELSLNEIDNLHKAKAHNNWSAIESIAHKLKGGSLYCGATRMYYACLYLERFPKDGQGEFLDKVYAQCLTVLNQTVADINQCLNKHDAKPTP